MKNIIAFTVSFLAALVLFCTAAALCFGLSSGLTNKDSGTENEINETQFEQIKESPIPLLVLYDNSDKLEYLCLIKIHPKTKQVTATNINISTIYDNKTLNEIYICDGIYCLTNSVGLILGEQKPTFIKISPKNFEKLADRTGGLVYNDSQGNEILLTAVQATEVLNPKAFESFCAQIAKSSLEKDLVSEFFFAVNLCENNFSYPLFYRRLYE